MKRFVAKIAASVVGAYCLVSYFFWLFAEPPSDWARDEDQGVI